MQETAKEKRIRKSNRTSLINRNNDNERNKIKPTSRSRRKKRTPITYVNFLTSNNLNRLNSLRINAMFGKGLFEYRGIVDLIKDIYPIIKDDISIFLPTQTFDENTHPADFLHWMINCYEDIHADTNWEIFKAYREEQFRIERVTDYQHSEDGQSASLDFLPKLKRENEQSYELLISILSHMYSELNIPFYFSDDELDYAIDTTKENVSEMKDELKSQNICSESKKEMRRDIRAISEYIKEYENGAVKETENDIKGITFKILSLKQIHNRVEKYDECDVVEFVREALKLFNYNVKFYDFLHYVGEELEGGAPVSPYNYAGIGWNFDCDNPVANNLTMIHECNWNEYGSVPFRHLEINEQDEAMSSFPHCYLMVLEKLCRLST